MELCLLRSGCVGQIGTGPPGRTGGQLRPETPIALQPAGAMSIEGPHRGKERVVSQKKNMISVRLTDEERQKLAQLCAASGLPVSTVIRKLIQGITICQRRPGELHELYVEINRIGTNINQIAKKANAGFATREDIKSLKFFMGLIDEKMARIAAQ